MKEVESEDFKNVSKKEEKELNNISINKHEKKVNDKPLLEKIKEYKNRLKELINITKNNHDNDMYYDKLDGIEIVENDVLECLKKFKEKLVWVDCMNEAGNSFNECLEELENSFKECFGELECEE